MAKTKKPQLPDETPKEVNVLTSADVHRGVYSNVAVVHHTENEFLMDFMLQVGSDAQLVSRVIFSPAHMRAFKRVIDDNLEKYDERFGLKQRQSK